MSARSLPPTSCQTLEYGLAVVKNQNDPSLDIDDQIKATWPLYVRQMETLSRFGRSFTGHFTQAAQMAVAQLQAELGLSAGGNPGGGASLLYESFSHRWEQQSSQLHVSCV